jgi:hydroxypyruvate reductase
MAPERYAAMMSLSPAAVLRELFAAAVAAAQPAACLPPHLPKPPAGRTVVVGLGKAAAAMAEAVEAHYPAPVTGVVVCPYGAARPLRQLRLIEAGHPVADDNSMAAANAILAAVRGLAAQDLVIALISGGGSALAALPVAGVALAEKTQVVGELMRAGAPIEALNHLRAALSRFKAGGLLRAIGPARCLSLLISDVVGDDPAVIASGPTVPRAIDPARIIAALADHGVVPPRSVADHLRALAPQPLPPPPPSSEVRLIATPRMALEAAAARARAMGLHPRILGDAMVGDPAAAARVHLAAAATMAAGEVLLSGGELTTVVRAVVGEGGGRGGPNLEFCLELVAQGLPPGLHALAADSDGRDGNSGVAGAVVNAATSAAGAAEALARSASFDYLARHAEIVDPGWTGTNVNDLRAVLRL